jgi:hypothetical protein
VRPFTTSPSADYEHWLTHARTAAAQFAASPKPVDADTRRRIANLTSLLCRRCSALLPDRFEATTGFEPDAKFRKGNISRRALHALVCAFLDFATGFNEAELEE